jgi:hypothetical protein
VVDRLHLVFGEYSLEQVGLEDGALVLVLDIGGELGLERVEVDGDRR